MCSATTHPSIHPFIRYSIHPSFFPPFHPSTHASSHLSNHHQSEHRSIHPANLCPKHPASSEHALTVVLPIGQNPTLCLRYCSSPLVCCHASGPFNVPDIHCAAAPPHTLQQAPSYCPLQCGRHSLAGPQSTAKELQDPSQNVPLTLHRGLEGRHYQQLCSLAAGFCAVAGCRRMVKLYVWRDGVTIMVPDVVGDNTVPQYCATALGSYHGAVLISKFWLGPISCPRLPNSSSTTWHHLTHTAPTHAPRPGRNLTVLACCHPKLQYTLHCLPQSDSTLSASHASILLTLLILAAKTVT